MRRTGKITLRLVVFIRSPNRHINCWTKELGLYLLKLRYFFSLLNKAKDEPIVMTNIDIESLSKKPS